MWRGMNVRGGREGYSKAIICTLYGKQISGFGFRAFLIKEHERVHQRACKSNATNQEMSTAKRTEEEDDCSSRE